MNLKEFFESASVEELSAALESFKYATANCDECRKHMDNDRCVYHEEDCPYGRLVKIDDTFSCDEGYDICKAFLTEVSDELKSIIFDYRGF